MAEVDGKGLSFPGCGPGSAWLLLVEFLLPLPPSRPTGGPHCPGQNLISSVPGPLWWRCCGSEHLGFRFLGAAPPFSLAEVGSVGGGRDGRGLRWGPTELLG